MRHSWEETSNYSIHRHYQTNSSISTGARGGFGPCETRGFFQKTFCPWEWGKQWIMWRWPAITATRGFEYWLAQILWSHQIKIHHKGFWTEGRSRKKKALWQHQQGCKGSVPAFGRYLQKEWSGFCKNYNCAIHCWVSMRLVLNWLQCIFLVVSVAGFCWGIQFSPKISKSKQCFFQVPGSRAFPSTSTRKPVALFVNSGNSTKGSRIPL